MREFLRPSNWKMWIVFCFVFKLVQGYFLLSGLNPQRGYYVGSGDSEYYFKLAYNLMRDKGYWLWRRHIYPDAIRDIEWDKDPNANLQKEFAFRMPGYAVLLFPALQVLGIDGGMNFIVLIQLIFSAIAAYFLAHLVYMLTKSKLAFAAFLSVYLLSVYVSKYAFYIMSESLSISLLIIALHFAYVTTKKGTVSPWMFLLMGFNMMMAIFMRPFFIPFFGLITVYMIYKTLGRPQGKVKLLLFIAPIIVIESLWVVRNYKNTEEFILLETSTHYAKSLNKTFQEWNNFVIKSGENWLFWEKTSLSAWILPDSFFAKGINPLGNELLPDWIKEDQELMDLVQTIKSDYNTCLDRSIPIEDRLQLQEVNIARISGLTNEVRERYPFKYYIGNKLKIFHNFIEQKFDMSYRSMRFPSNILYSFIGSGINYFVQYFCFAMILILLVVFGKRLFRKNFVLLIMLFIPLFVSVMFSVVYGMADHRHLTYAYPFLLLGGIYSLHQVFEKSKTAGWVLSISGGLVFLLTGIHTLVYYINW